MAQSVERRIGSAEVTGPIPVSSLHQEMSKTLFFKDFRHFLLLEMLLHLLHYITFLQNVILI